MLSAPLSKTSLEAIQAKINNKTKPLGALGALEVLALQLALITEQRHRLSIDLPRDNKQVTKANKNIEGKISIEKPTMLVFAGDHGINEENLSIAPSEVTRQMVSNFLQGGAAINCFCQSNSIALTIVDCGILRPIVPHEIATPSVNNIETPKLLEQRLGEGTHNFSITSAMSFLQVQEGFKLAKNLVNAQISEGVEIILLGEMGIGNTSSAAALMSALTLFSVEQCVGRGTGITDEQLAKKIYLIEQALKRVSCKTAIESSPSTSIITQFDSESSQGIIQLLAELGGFEIVQMVSAILTAAAANVPVVIDGFIVSVAALIALRLDDNIADYLIFSHVSQEKAHQLLLNELLSAQSFSNDNPQPLLTLGLRLGEGTGAALSLPLIQAAASFYNNMASFESAGVTV